MDLAILILFNKIVPFINKHIPIVELNLNRIKMFMSNGQKNTCFSF